MTTAAHRPRPSPPEEEDHPDRLLVRFCFGAETRISLTSAPAPQRAGTGRVPTNAQNGGPQACALPKARS